MFVGENDFFIISTMIEDRGEISFEKDEIADTLGDCVESVEDRIRKETGIRFTEAELKGVSIPTKEEIYSSLFSDKYLCYIIGEKSDEYKFVFHVSKFSVGNTVEKLEMSFCQK